MKADEASDLDDALPPIELAPPYSLDFVAHLDAGCYPDDLSDALLAAVCRDEHGRRLLDALIVSRLEVRTAGE